MSHRIELAPTGRAKCRACKRPIAKAALRLGVSVPNAFGEGQALQWFHLICGAERRPQEFFAALEGADRPETLPEETLLRARAQIGVDHPRWTRAAWAERASTGRAKCRHCRESIAQGGTRLALEFVEEGMINPSGFLHPGCARAYMGTVEHLSDRLRRSSQLEPHEFDLLDQELEAGDPAPVGVADGEGAEAPPPTFEET